MTSTRPTDADVDAFVAAVPSAARRRDAERLLELYARVTGEPATMWGPSIVGYGSYHYRYASGREGEMAAAGFSPRKAATTLYLVDGFDQHADLLDRLGPHTRSVSCLYLRSLDDVDLGVLEQLVARSYATVTAPGFGTPASDG